MEEKRKAWEMDQWIWKWIAISTGSVGLIIIFLTAYLDQMNLMDLALALIIGGGIAQIAFFSFTGLVNRVQDEQSALNKNVVFGASLIVILIAIVGQAYAGIPGFFSYMIIGVGAVAFGNSMMKARDVHEPRVFVEVENDGTILMLKKGEMLLSALESAGYKLLTHCGGKGDCASCRVNLREFNQEITSDNYGPVLTPRQQNEGWAISCSLPVMDDMKVRLYKPLVVRWAGFRRSQMSEQAREVREALPGFDCEACGYPTCDMYAVAIAEGKVGTTDCLPGGEAVSKRVDAIIADFPTHAGSETQSEVGAPNA